ncbi:pseudouridine synthase, partial [Patescibacteria group bacterium]|nr:pseudouridine synthase [Patescibacteria group bacterium]
ILEQGQKRQIRLLLKLAGYEVIDLKRTGLGPLKLGRLPIGAVRSLNTAEIDRLKQLIQDKQ